MNRFTALLPTAMGKFPFHFQKIVTANAVKFQVSIWYKVGKVYIFIMVGRAGSWVIVDAPKVPDWIMNVEGYLSQAIAQNEPIAC